jgi:uncharacterized protein (TIGR03435 family)
MIPTYWAALGNHLWQSTVVAGVAALLAVALRHNTARVRYWIWFAAGIKFLVPLSLLVVVGQALQWRSSPPIAQKSISTVAEISMPFEPSAALSLRPAMAPVEPQPNWVSTTLLSIWICGFLISVGRWLRSWRRVRVAVAAAVPLELELQTCDVPVRMLSSPILFEPAVVGIFKSILLLPAGIAERMTAEQLQAILIHELCHIRRRDNLAATIYMLAETVFWFYPLVHWIGKRLIEERERACDEEVLRLGHEPLMYAEAILSICKSYMEAPVRCVSGVTGSDLKKRIQSILSGAITADLNITKKVALAVAATWVVAVPFVIGMVQSSQTVQKFDVASVKLNKSTERGPQRQFKAVPGSGRLTVTGMTVRFVIQGAYGLQPYQLVSDKNPVLNEKIDIEAKTERPVSSSTQMQQMLQPLLEERFKLAIHRETRAMNAIVLTLAKDGRLGPKMKKSDRECEHLGTAATAFVLTPPPAAGERPACGFTPSGVGRIVGVGLDMPTIIDLIETGPLALPMVDETGLNDRYDIDVTYTPTPFSAATLARTGREPMPGVDPNGPSLLNAIEEQLGFKLQTKKMPIPVVVIDHIEPLTQN